MKCYSFDFVTKSAALILAFGLMSCQPDKNKTPDSWAVPSPLVKTTEQDVGLSLAQASVTAVSPNAYLSFPNTATGTQLLVKTTCNFEGSVYDTAVAGQLAPKIPLQSLLPREIWQQPTEKQVETARCTLKFEAKKENGSSHSFTFANLHFGRQEADVAQASLPVVDLETTLPAPKNFERLNPLAVQPLETKEPQRTVSVVCDHFRNSMSVPAGFALNSVMHQLLTGQIQGDNVHAGDPVVDHRSGISHQVCRIFQESIDANSRLPSFSKSPTFVAHFAPARAISDVRFPLSEFTSALPLEQLPLLVVFFKNSQSVPITYRLSRQSRPLELRTVWRNEGKNILGRPIHATVEPVLDGGVIMKNDPVYIDFQLQPGAQATLTLKMHAPQICNLLVAMPADQLIKSLRESNSLFYGFRYKIGNEWSLKQFRVYPKPDDLDENSAMFQPLADLSLKMSRDTNGQSAPIYDSFIPNVIGMKILETAITMPMPAVDQKIESWEGNDSFLAPKTCSHLIHPLGVPEYSANFW